MAKMVELNVEGMTCRQCALCVEQALLAVDGVKKATVDLDMGYALVKTGDNVEVQVLLDAVDNAGYKASDATLHI